MKNDQIFNTYINKINELLSTQSKSLLEYLKNQFTEITNKKYLIYLYLN